MRSVYQLLIIVLVVFSLYSLRDDLKTIYTRVLSSIEQQDYDTKIIEVTNAVKNSIPLKQPAVATATKSTKTPGPLRVANSTLTSNSNNVRLSIEAVIAETNNARAQNGDLPPLSENKKLDASAEIKLKDMFAKQYFEHESPSGVGVSDLGDKVEYEYILIGENLALGNFKDNKSLLDAWMASPGHRANILNKGYKEIGVAVGRGVFQGEDTWLAVQHFGTPKKSCPAIDTVLKNVINIKQQAINDKQKTLTQMKADIDSGVVADGKTTNEQIMVYNEIVKEYNSLLAEVKNSIITYNTEVKNFNTCVNNFESTITH